MCGYMLPKPSRKHFVPEPCSCQILHGPPRRTALPAHPPRSVLDLVAEYTSQDEPLWRFAKTMPDNPHAYAVRPTDTRGDQRWAEHHEALFGLIRDWPWHRFFRGRPFRSVTVGGFTYWIIRDGQIINRKPDEPAAWDAPPEPIPLD